jgi:hypothetical protein
LPCSLTRSLRRKSAYQHIEPEIDLVSRFDQNGFFSETGKLKKIPVSLTNFDVFWTGARIQF